jgi:hypothetical protein
MNNFLHLDLYRTNTNLYINKESKMRTLFGTYISLIMITISIIIIILEFHEVITNSNPMIIKNTYDSAEYNQDLSITPENFRLRIIPLNKTLSRHFKLEYHIAFYHFDNNVYKAETITLNNLTNFYSIMGSKRLKAFNITISLHPCEAGDTGCTVKNDLKDELINGTNKFEVSFEFGYLFQNIDDNSHTVVQSLKGGFVVSKISSNTAIKLKPFEIYSKFNYLFDYVNVLRTFQIEDISLKYNEGLSSSISLICQKGGATVVTRYYKKMSTAIINSYVLIALLFILSNLFMSCYYRNRIDKQIISKTFDIDKSIAVSSNTRGNNLSSMQFESNDSNKIIKYNYNREVKVQKTKCQRLARYICLCYKQHNSKEVSYFLQANAMVRKYLSVENILNIILDYIRLKDHLTDRGEANITTEKRHILLGKKNLSARGYRRLFYNQFDNPGTIV